MDREEARRYVNQQEPTFLQAARRKVEGQTTYICPSCGNGSGEDGDGILRVPEGRKGAGHYKCFKCGLSEDVIGLWKLHTGTTEDAEAFREVYQYYGISENTAPDPADRKPKEYQNQPRNEQKQKDTHALTYTHIQPDYMDYYRECMERISSTDYPQSRGLADEVISNFMLGYDPHYRRGTGGREWQALIIPTGRHSYVARNTDQKADKKDRYRKHGASQIYNTRALREAKKPIFVVEGELDALSIISAGGTAVALGSTANHSQLAGLVEAQKPSQPLIIALDNDEDGEKTAGELMEELAKIQSHAYKLNIYGDKKDANEALTADREGFRRAVSEAETAALDALAAEREAYTMKNSAASYLQGFINGIADSVNTPYIPTGYEQLDKELDGGLFEGLYIIGAISSVGKTTLVTQIADQIADAGTDVLIFSLEMARSELMAKSISRLTLLDVLENNGNLRDAKTTRGITTGVRYANYSKTEKNLIQRAITSYGSYADKIYILEGMGEVGVEQVREEIRNHIFFTGKKPVVIVDYLQIMAPADPRASDKQNTDKAVLELKRISRDYKLPVIAISSFNRESYRGEATMEAFKESGAIEYGSDVLIGLQLKGAGSSDFDANKAKKKNPREVELLILKNRNGATGGKVEMEYYPLFNYFKEI